MTWALHYIGAQFIDEGLRFPSESHRLRIAQMLYSGSMMRA